MEDDQFDDEVNNLIEWCEDLDFDKYCESWLTMATSAKPNLPTDDNNVQVYGLGLGDITIGLGPNTFQGQASGTINANDLGAVAGATHPGNYTAQQLSTQQTHQDGQQSHLSVKGGVSAAGLDNSTAKALNEQ